MSARILFVDDDHDTRLVFSQLLTLEGHSVDPCAGAEPALQLLATRAYDLLITDYVMPGMTGLALARAARVLCATIRCCVVSGHPRPRVEELADIVWLGKPIDIDELLRALNL